MIRLGIVGCNYGRTILLPAFRTDPRCQVVALAGTDQARTAALARQAGIPTAFGDWRAMIEGADIDAVAIATPPRFQPEIAVCALERDKAVFIEKPMAADLAGASAMMQALGLRPNMIDFGFTEIAAWKKAKAMIEAGAIGRLRHLFASWNVENQSTRERLKNWKTNGAVGGGALGNLASHSLHYFEWFCGPIADLSARLATLPDDPDMEVTVVLSLGFVSGATGNLALSSASYCGSGHRLEFYGEDGALVLTNPTSDYMRGFSLFHARRPNGTLVAVPVDPDPRDDATRDGRIAPVSRLASRFLDAIEQRTQVAPGFAEGYRVQVLLDAARRSHTQGLRIAV
ncbi:MAG TPA: Gfo/Idh/MocA family oxidoreductase [Xanthobacteraceae bacterium]|nr:Gfo/Idh/MocA family oxidoreductase [Xanthobacteraceae bacterium]